MLSSSLLRSTHATAAVKRKVDGPTERAVTPCLQRASRGAGARLPLPAHNHAPRHFRQARIWHPNNYYHRVQPKCSGEMEPASPASSVSIPRSHFWHSRSQSSLLRVSPGIVHKSN